MCWRKEITFGHKYIISVEVDPFLWSNTRKKSIIITATINRKGKYHCGEKSLSQVFTQRASLHHSTVYFSGIQGKDLFLPLSFLLAIFTDHNYPVPSRTWVRSLQTALTFLPHCLPISVAMSMTFFLEIVLLIIQHYLHTWECKIITILSAIIIH